MTPTMSSATATALAPSSRTAATTRSRGGGGRRRRRRKKEERIVQILSSLINVCDKILNISKQSG